MNETKGEQRSTSSALIKEFVTLKIDVSVNGQAFFDPVFKWYLSDLKINLSNKRYSRDNRLNKVSKVTLSECFGTSMSAYVNRKSVVSLLVRVLIG